MRFVFGVLFLFVFALAVPAHAAVDGAPELLIFFNKSTNQLVFKQYPYSGMVDTDFKSGKESISYTATSVPTSNEPTTTISVKGIKESFKLDGMKVTRYEHHFKTIKYGDNKKKKYGWDYELVARYEDTRFVQRYKVDGVVRMMVEYDPATNNSKVYVRSGGKMILKESVEGTTTLLIRTYNGFMQPFVDTDL